MLTKKSFLKNLIMTANEAELNETYLLIPLNATVAHM